MTDTGGTHGHSSIGHVEFTRPGLSAAGFTGFEAVASLHDSRCEEITRGPGVYAVVRDDAQAARFLATNGGGHFKGRDPTVVVELLRARWLLPTPVLYLGKATSLKERIHKLVRFGRGQPVAHWGGRYLWQVADSERFLVAWRPCDQPRAEERALLGAFTDEFGCLPFANIQR